MPSNATFRIKRLLSGAILTLALAQTACANNQKAVDVSTYAQQPIAQIQRAFQQDKLTATALTQHFIDKIREQDSRFNAVIAINPNAIEEAQRLDAERQQGKLRGALHGIPILVKDNIETLELPTTAGSLALQNNRTNRDAATIAQLRSQGAIILGKTNLSEWASFRSTRSSSGWSSVGGQTHNYHQQGKSPCGSSSGSAVAVAAGFAVAALGTETNGSITCPASMNGIVGIKPSIGVVSQQGIVPISFSQDTAGPMTKSVADAYIMLQAMRTDGNAQPNKLAATTLQGKRIGILRAKMGYYPEVDATFAEKVKQLTSAGVEVVDSLSFDTYSGFKQDSHIVLGVEFKHALNRYFASLPDPSLSQLTLGKLIEYNLEHKQTVMPFFGQEVFLLANQMPPIDAPMYLDARGRVQKASGVDGIDKLLSDNKLDAIIVPTTSPAWSIDKVLGDHYVGGFSDYPAIAGYPHVTMPLGKIQGLPFGLSITAGKGADEALLQLALAIEQL